MKNHFRFVLLLIVAALTGCAAKSIQTDFSFKNDPNVGLVVLSVSHGFGASKSTKAIFQLDGGAASGGESLWSLEDSFPGVSKNTEFKDSFGRLIVLALPAGRHEITGWQISAGDHFVRPVQVQPLVFNVVKGEIKYIGNLHANVIEGRNLLGMRMAAADAYPEIRDKQQRDIPLFEQRYPQFKGQVKIDLLELGPWIDNRDGRRVINGAPVIVPVMPIQK